MIHTGGIFQDKKFADRCWTHDFGELVKLAGMQDELNASLDASAKGNGAFVGHWGIATQWKETSRYESKTEAEARSLHDAITNDPDGVLKWIQNYW
jgi:hypothetical protein